jgi:hypothetical protein
MELLNALLAGFFFWLLDFRFRRNAASRARQWGGELLTTATADSWGYWRLGCVLLLLALAALIGLVVMTFFSFERRAPLWIHLCIAVLLWMTLRCMIAFRRRRVTLEVRRHGLVHTLANGWPDWFVFTPWQEIEHAVWEAAPGRLAIEGAEAAQWIAVSPGQKDAVTAALGRFTPVYDHDDVLLAQPEPSDASEALPPSPRGHRFQFDLQVLLILVVVVACLANWGSLRYRYLHTRQQTVTRLQLLGAEVGTWDNENIWGVNFSRCPSKANDADLASLVPHEELRWVVLAGSRVTDAGLARLEGLKQLRSVDLTGTAVTAAGAEKLHRALPKATIWYGFTFFPIRLKPLEPDKPESQ